jgi:hypothetical protein
MVAQTSVNTNGSGTAGTSPQQAVARNTGELLGDAMTLAELQGKLLLVDVQDDLQRLILPFSLLVTGAVLALTCLPIALVTIALGLIAGADLAPWLAFLITLGGALLVALGLILCGVWYFRHGLTFLNRSRAEWDQNIRWFKSLVRRLGASSPSRPAEPGHA